MIASGDAVRDFVLGTTGSVEACEVVTQHNCNRCHDDIAAHGFGRRGLETCTLCHSTPGAEDGAKYSFAAWYVPPTPGVTVDFRTMPHKIHTGKGLANASTYTVNGVFLGTAYPVHYDEVGFRVTPGGAQNCTICHGTGGDPWKVPADRDHLAVPAAPTREWPAACGGCHDSDAALAHIDTQTSGPGGESCTVCHGSSGEWSVERVHKTY